MNRLVTFIKGALRDKVDFLKKKFDNNLLSLVKDIFPQTQLATLTIFIFFCSEKVIFKVYEEKNQSWEKEYKNLRLQYENNLKNYYQKLSQVEHSIAVQRQQVTNKNDFYLLTIF